MADEWAEEVINLKSDAHEDFPTPDRYNQQYHAPEEYSLEELDNGKELWLALMQPKENKKEAEKLINKGLWGHKDRNSMSLGSRLDSMGFERIRTNFDKKGHLEITANIGGSGHTVGFGGLPGIDTSESMYLEIRSTNTDEERIKILDAYDSSQDDEIPQKEGNFYLDILSVPNKPPNTGHLNKHHKMTYEGMDELIHYLSRQLRDRDMSQFQDERDRSNMFDLIGDKRIQLAQDIFNANKPPSEQAPAPWQESLTKEGLRDLIREVIRQEKKLMTEWRKALKQGIL